MNEVTASWMSVFRTTFRLLTFRSTREEFLSFGWKHFAFGLFCTWLVGMGRYWDNSRVSVLQHLGIGSVVYVFALSGLLYLLALPLRPKETAKDWTYFRVCTFISLVSPLAILYAIPVERAFDIEIANTINFWFLAVVAMWRVALLVFFFRRFGALDWLSVVTVTLLPLTLIVVSLTFLNLERVVFNIMGGINPEAKSGNDAAYDFLIFLTLFAMLSFVPLLICYCVLAVVKSVARRNEKKSASLINP